MTRARAADAIFYLAAIILAVHARAYGVLSCVPLPDVGPHSPPAIAGGVASTPYQYHVLVPAIVAAAMAANVLPAITQQDAFTAVAAASAMLIVVVLRAFLLRFIRVREVASVASLSIHAVLPLMAVSGQYAADDLPAVLFFTVGLICLHRRAWWTLLGVFAAAALNRETSLLLAFVTVATGAGRMPRRTLTVVVSAQAVVWTVIQFALWNRYAGNPWLGTGIYHPPLLVNAAAVAMFSNRALLAVSTCAGVSALAFAWRQSIADPFLRRAVSAIPLLTWATFFAGFVSDLRMPVEVAPLIVTGGWVVLMHRVERLATAPNGQLA